MSRPRCEPHSQKSYGLSNLEACLKMETGRSLHLHVRIFPDGTGFLQPSAQGKPLCKPPNGVSDDTPLDVSSHLHLVHLLHVSHFCCSFQIGSLFWPRPHFQNYPFRKWASVHRFPIFLGAVTFRKSIGSSTHMCGH